MCCADTRVSQVTLVVKKKKKNPLASLGDARDVFDLWVGKILWSRKWQPAPIFAWEIPCVEEPGGLQSIALKRVRHN